MRLGYDTTIIIERKLSNDRVWKLSFIFMNRDGCVNGKNVQKEMAKIVRYLQIV